MSHVLQRIFLQGRPSKAKELFVQQILLRDLRLDTFELKNTKSDWSV